MTERRTRRSGARRQLVTILWRDIPAQVTASDGERAHKALLPTRFQHAIDRAARIAGLTERHDYIAQWRRETAPIPDGLDAQDAVESAAARLDAAYDREALADLVRAGGLRADEHSTGAGT